MEVLGLLLKITESVAWDKDEHNSWKLKNQEDNSHKYWTKNQLQQSSLFPAPFQLW